MSKLRRKHSECPSFPLAAEVLAVRELLSAGAAGAIDRHALHHAGSEIDHQAKSTPTFAGFTGPITGNSTPSTGGAATQFTGVWTIGPFHIKKNATVTVSFGPGAPPLPPTLTFKFKINAIAQDGETFDLSGKQVAASGQTDGKSLGLSKSITHLEIKNGVPDSCTATFTNHPGQKTSTLLLTFGPGPA